MRAGGRPAGAVRALPERGNPVPRLLRHARVVRRGPTGRRPMAVRSSLDRGSGTVLAVGLVGVLATLLIAGLLVTATAMAGQRARTAADLAVLAVAGRALEGAAGESACAVGAQVAARHGASVVSCRVVATLDGLPRAEVEVSKVVEGTPWAARARAAAGGVPADGR